ncbi:hypothetical protein PHLGIDRAFT_20280, partial [Phlebiopsis gigantea 11061_1 CR5-6]
MSMPTHSGGYRIRNLGTNRYIALERGYVLPGQKAALKSYSQETTHSWLVEHVEDGIFRVRPFANAHWQIHLLAEMKPTDHRTNRILEVNNDTSFLWRIWDTPNRQGVFMSYYQERDQVAEADPTTGNIMLANLNTVRDDTNQMWVLEVV